MEKLTIVKRDGTLAPFSTDKIVKALVAAFQSVKEELTMEALSNILAHLKFHEGITVEEIQNQVEVALMQEGHYSVAKSFMLYRQQHTDDRDTMEKLAFLSGYCNAKNAASGSKYDANANVEHKNIATLVGELPKGNFIRLNRKMLVDRIKQMYGKELADEYLYYLNNHFIYRSTNCSWKTIISFK